MTDTKEATMEAKPEESVPAAVVTEIDEAIGQAIEEKKSDEAPASEESAAEEKPASVEDTPKEGEEDPAVQGDEETDESDQEPQGEESPVADAEGEEGSPSPEVERSDELVTRAVRSGMSLRDAKAIVSQDADALERQIQLLEKASQPQGDKASEGEGDASAGVGAGVGADPLEGIPDLDPEVYDENIVAGFKAMKSVIKQQSETIQQLSSGGEKSWFNKQVESLKMGNLDGAKQAKLNDQFDALKAGYAAQGKEVDDGVAFQQATQLVLGDDIEAAAEADKGKKLKQRAKLQTNRPGGPAVKPKGDPLTEIAEEINQEFFNKR